MNGRISCCLHFYLFQAIAIETLEPDVPCTLKGKPPLISLGTLTIFFPAHLKLHPVATLHLEGYIIESIGTSPLFLLPPLLEMCPSGTVIREPTVNTGCLLFRLHSMTSLPADSTTIPNTTTKNTGSTVPSQSNIHNDSNPMHRTPLRQAFHRETVPGILT